MKTSFKVSAFLTAFSFLIGAQQLSAQQIPAQSNWPRQPISEDHPGSSNYPYQLTKQNFSVRGRAVDVYFPTEKFQSQTPMSVIVFGHGQAMNASHYENTFEHLAKKGIAVIHPTYDSGFFDQDWRRMANDFNDLTFETFKKYPFLNNQQVVFAGHSKGGYIALMAAGLPQAQLKIKPRALVLFAPAGYDKDYIKQIDPTVPVNVFWSDSDTIIKKSAIDEIYQKLTVTKKQLFTVADYKNVEPALPADHFFPANKKALLGGRDGVSPFHYFGVWPWLMASVDDIQNGEKVESPYLYGSKAIETGVDGHLHKVSRNW